MTLLRSALFNLFFVLVTTAFCLFGVLLLTQPAERMLRLAMAWSRVVLRALRLLCGIDYRVQGAEHLPRDGAALIASEHQSAFDTIVFFSLVPRCAYVMKRELLRVPILGRLAPHAGMIPVDRHGGAGAIRSLLRAAEQAAHERRQIVIFPEGTRAEPGVELPLQPGVAALAARTALPVIPVRTNSGAFWGRRAFRKQPGLIRIDVRPPIAPGIARDELMRRLAAVLRGADESVMHPVDNPVG
jgi:1-acyl-sn-glycerol-3-phosphate acyltransferase